MEEEVIESANNLEVAEQENAVESTVTETEATEATEQVAEQVEEVEETKQEEQETEKQSDEENAKYANIRRKAHVFVRGRI